MAATDSFRILPATRRDLPLILRFIRELAEYERLLPAVVATEETLDESLFGNRPAAEVVLAYAGEEPAGFAVFFETFSTFVGRPGMHLEDLYVVPQWRKQGLGRKLLAYLARIAVDRNYGRMEWSVLDWNEPALRVYRTIGADAMSDWTVYRLSGAALNSLAAEEGQGG